MQKGGGGVQKACKDGYVLNGRPPNSLSLSACLSNCMYKSLSSSVPSYFIIVFGSRLTIKYSIYCAQHYFRVSGTCGKYCEGLDSIDGHYRCDDNGNRICLPGNSQISDNTGHFLKGIASLAIH